MHDYESRLLFAVAMHDLEEEAAARFDPDHVHALPIGSMDRLQGELAEFVMLFARLTLGNSLFATHRSSQDSVEALHAHAIKVKDEDRILEHVAIMFVIVRIPKPIAPGEMPKGRIELRSARAQHRGKPR